MQWFSWKKKLKIYDEIEKEYLPIVVVVILHYILIRTDELNQLSQSDCKIELIDKTLHNFSALIATIICHHYRHRHDHYYSKSYALTLFWFPEIFFFFFFLVFQTKTNRKSLIVLQQYTWWQCKIVSCSKKKINKLLLIYDLCARRCFYLVVFIFTFLSIVKHIILNHITAINYRCVCYLKKKKVQLRAAPLLYLVLAVCLFEIVSPVCVRSVL